jgi:hypothetical protein
VNFYWFDLAFWTIIVLNAFILNTALLFIMLPLSEINQQTVNQTIILVKLKDNLLRLIRDRNILGHHPLQVENRVHQLAIKEYRRLTTDLTGAEKEEKMVELATQSYEAVTDAIDILKDFADYTPVKFLGSIVLYPDTINQTLSTVLTLVFVLVQEKYLAPLQEANETTEI